MKRTHIKPLVLALALVAASPANADERQQLEALRATTFAILDALVEKGILTDEVAKTLVKQAEAKGQEAAAATKADSGVVRVRHVPESVKKEIREHLRQEIVAQAKTERWGDVNAVPEWVDRLKWEGDIRVRQQSDMFDSGNLKGQLGISQYQFAGINLNNAEEDRDRLRVRARLGLTAKLSTTVSSGFRLSTGNTSDPVSTNQTLGNTANKYSLMIDRAFLKMEPWEWLGVSGGRIPNPFFSTDLVWDDDLNFEGIAATFQPLARSQTATLKPFTTLGFFPLQEIESSPNNLAKDKWLYGAQVGVDWTPSLNARWRVGLAYYDYRNITGVADTILDGKAPYSSTAPQFRQKGNSVFDISEDSSGQFGLAAKYRLANLTATVDLAHFDPLHIIVSGDVVKNIGYESGNTAARMNSPGYEAKTLGWQGRVAVGMRDMRQRHNWQAYLGYRYLERDAVLDAFTDSDFRLGGTDAKGYFLGGMYALESNTWLSAKWLSADEIDGLPFSVDVLQVDLNAKF
jgi:hypothetical protein